jgi:uncharacterized Fe-S radical SAM superfamily protein PflX
VPSVGWMVKTERLFDRWFPTTMYCPQACDVARTRGVEGQCDVATPCDVAGQCDVATRVMLQGS